MIAGRFVRHDGEDHDRREDVDKYFAYLDIALDGVIFTLRLAQIGAVDNIQHLVEETPTEK